jgi:hypothetical protein
MRCINSDFIIATSAGAGWQIGELSVNLVSAPTRTPAPYKIFINVLATGLGATGLLGWRRKRKGQAVA